MHIKQRILQKGDEALKQLGARRDGTRLGKPHNHAEGSHRATSISTERQK